MKKHALSLAILSGLAISNASHAADWMSVQGLEPANAPAYHIWGFVQPTYTYIDSKPVTGLQGAAATYNNHQQIPNLVGPDLDSTQNIQLFRARLGVRGKLKAVDDRINYFILTEAGRNGVTREQSVALSDASMTFSYIPGAHIRAGLFKLPTGEEALSAVHVDYNYVNFTNVTDGLLNERDLTAQAAIPGTPAGLSAATVKGSLSGFRDVGVEVFNTFRKSRWELGYAAMVSNGNNINFITDNNHSKDFTGRLQVSYVFNGAGPTREDVNAFIWHQEGKRTFNGADYNRMREGAGFKYMKDKLRFSGEFIRGAGMIYNGPNPPFVDIPTDTTPAPVDTVALQDYNKADGWYLEGGYKFLPNWRANIKYDVYHRLTNSQQAGNQRNFNTWTIGGEYLLSKATHFTMTYEIRKAEVANPSALTGATLNNALILADNLGNRFSLQMTHIFF